MRKFKLLMAACALIMGATAAWAEDVDYTSYITNANLSSTDGWTLQATGGSWSNVQGSSPSYVIEAYAGWGSLDLTAYSMKQNVTLPSGKYRAEGYAFYRYGVNADTDASKSYAKFVAGDFNAPVVTLGGETLDGTLTAYPNNTGEASAAFTNGYYKSQVEFAIESESTIEFGYEGTHVLKQSWFIAGPIKLYRTGDFDYTLYQSQLESLVSDAKALQSSTMAASIKTALNSVISTYDGQTCSSVADYNTAYAALNAAIANANTSIASYAIIASGTVSTSSLDGWTCTNSNTFHINTWSVEGNSDGSNMTTPFIENWVASGTYLGEGTFSYTIEGLEPGEVYYAQALIRSYNEKNSDAPNGPNFFINDTDIDLTEAGTTFTYNNKSGIYATLGGAATVGADGKLTLGARIASTANYNWVAFKNVSIQSMDDALDAAVAKVTALEGNVPTAVYNTAYAVVEANTGANKPGTASEYETAIAAIENAATTASAFVSTFATWKAMKADAEVMQAVENTNSEANTTLADAISTQTTAANAATTTEGIETATAALKTAMKTYFNAAKPTSGNTFNVTFALNNPSFENNFTGWTNSGMATQGNNSFDKTGNIYVEAWQPNGTKSVTQTLTDMPAGQYRIAADIKARGVTSAKIFGGSEETAVTIEDAVNTYSVDFVYTGVSDFVFGFEGVGTGEGSSWLALDNFTLTYLREPSVADYKVDLATAVATATAARNAANEGTGVFQIPASAGTTLASAIETAQGVYDNASATVSEVQTAIANTDAAIETYNNATLNEPADGDVFNVMITTSDDYAFKNNPLTFNEDNASGAYFPQGIGVKAYRAQQMIFTKVEGNKYTVSTVNANGETVYIGTNKTINNSGTTSQIRLTTESSKALAIKVVPTSVDGVYNLLNTEDSNNKLGCQDNPAEKEQGGIYTTGSHSDFTITAATKPSVDINIDAAVKYATRIFPFTPALPSGVTAYSCEAADDNTLTLEEVATPAANVPYILYAEEGNSGSLSGWGTASTTTYTTGWLTGTYEDMAAPNESYILQNQSGTVGFYQVDIDEATPQVKANRAYMTIPSGARAYFFAGGEATAVKALNALTSGKAEIFNLKGERISKLQKGMNIIMTDGKSLKVMVK